MKKSKAESPKKLRDSLGLTQVEFGLLCGVHPITVSKWERNEAQPSEHLKVLFKKFKKSAAKLQPGHLKEVLHEHGFIAAHAKLIS